MLTQREKAALTIATRQLKAGTLTEENTSPELVEALIIHAGEVQAELDELKEKYERLNRSYMYATAPSWR